MNRQTTSMLAIAIVFSFILGSCSHTAKMASTQAEPGYAKGIVYYDKNGNGVYDRGDRGLKGVRLSNGVDVVETEDDGSYKIPVTDDTIVFVLKPRGWISPVSKDQIPRFYYIHKPEGSPQLKVPGVAPTGPLPASVDFPLYPNHEPDKFSALFFGDTQPRNQEEIDYIAHDICEENIGTESRFGVTLGDIVFNNIHEFEALNAAIGSIGVPWFNVIGNHDTNYDGSTDRLSDETYERIYGPSYYAFDYGSVHFIAMDNIYWDGKRYKGHFTDDLLTFLRNDLAGVPDSTLIVPMMHIPLDQCDNTKEFFAVLQSHPYTFSISAHWHRQRHLFFSEEDGWYGKEPHHHLINATTCGSWWGGLPNMSGVPHATMQDGGPNGYSIFKFDKNKYEIVFKAARHPADYQMHIFAPESVRSIKSGLVDVIANIFAGSERSTVEMRVGDDGPWVKMEKFLGQDPFFVLMHQVEKSINPHPKRTLSEPQDTDHLWRAKLPSGMETGSHVITVRTTDMFGHTYTAHRIIRIE